MTTVKKSFEEMTEKELGEEYLGLGRIYRILSKHRNSVIEEANKLNIETQKKFKEVLELDKERKKVFESIKKILEITPKWGFE